MEEFNIYKYIEEIELNKDNFLEFVTTVCGYFSKRFGVRECPVRLAKIEGLDYQGGYIPPAQVVGSILRYRSHRIGEERIELDLTIEFSYELLENINKARIVKLAAHEWMHFYDFLFRYNEVDISLINEDYKDLILKSHQTSNAVSEFKNKYSDYRYHMYIQKLSAKEIVADKHAITFLNELYANTTDQVLKDQIEKDIYYHEKQVEEYRNFLKENTVEEVCLIVK